LFIALTSSSIAIAFVLDKDTDAGMAESQRYVTVKTLKAPQ